MDTDAPDRMTEPRDDAPARVKPSEAFERHFGPEHGVELPPPSRHGYRPLVFGPRDEA